MSRPPPSHSPKPSVGSNSRTCADTFELCPPHHAPCHQRSNSAASVCRPSRRGEGSHAHTHANIACHRGCIASRSNPVWNRVPAHLHACGSTCHQPPHSSAASVCRPGRRGKGTHAKHNIMCRRGCGPHLETDTYTLLLSGTVFQQTRTPI